MATPPHHTTQYHCPAQSFPIPAAQHWQLKSWLKMEVPGPDLRPKEASEVGAF